MMIEDKIRYSVLAVMLSLITEMIILSLSQNLEVGDLLGMEPGIIIDPMVNNSLIIQVLNQECDLKENNITMA